MSNTVSQQKLSWIELDVLRGIAAIFMIVNHLGYKILSEPLTQEGLSEKIIFLGSFAPVLFFLTTGVGYGIQAHGKKPSDYWISTLYKVLILLIADQYLQWNRGFWIGLNFLGFIGLCSLVMVALRYTRQPVLVSIVCFCIISGLRYGAGPVIDKLNLSQGLIAWIVGNKAIEGIAYPLSPWMAYPFLGYIIGDFVIRYNKFFNRYRWSLVTSMFLLSFVPISGGFIIQKIGGSFFRWGTVGVGFYIISFAVILLSLILSIIIVSILKNNLGFISLRGISSLAVVPIHYYLLDTLVFNNLVNVNFVLYFLTSLIIIILSFYLSHFVDKISYETSKKYSNSLLRSVFVGILILTIIISLPYNGKPDLNIVTSTAQMFGQLSLCCLLRSKWW